MTRPSPWGELNIADAHVHFFSARFFELLAAQKQGLTFDALGWQMPDENLADVWVRELDRHGVSRAAIMASLPGDEESVIKAAAAHPDRFFTYAMVNPMKWTPADVDVACLFPAMQRYSIQSEESARVFDWAQSHKKAVFVHCGVLSVGIRTKLGLESHFDMRFSNPIDLHAVALRYPTVPIIVPHFGAGYFREALMLADLCPNVYFDTSSSNSWRRYEGLTLSEIFRRTLDVVGAKRLLFGTDSSFFPRGWNAKVFEDQAQALHDLNTDPEDAKLIFGENLLRILAR